MKTKIISTLLLISTLVILLCSCSVEKEQIVGVWTNDAPVYLEYYGSHCGKMLVFEDDGTVYDYLFDLDGEVLEASTGTYTIDGRKVRANYEDNPGTTVYNYSSGKLKNGSWTYVKE